MSQLVGVVGLAWLKNAHVCLVKRHPIALLRTDDILPFYPCVRYKGVEGVATNGIQSDGHSSDVHGWVLCVFAGVGGAG